MFRRMPSPLHLLLSIVIPMVVISLLAAGAGAIEFEEEPTPISRETDKEQTSVDLAVGTTDDLYAVWQDGRFSNFQEGDAVLFAISTSDDRGRKFGDPIQMAASLESADQWSPAITVGPDGTIHVVWQERSRTDDTPGGPYWEIRYSFSVDGGLSWSDPIPVSQPNNSNNTRPDVAGITNRSAYVVWTLDDHPGTSVGLAKVAQGSRVWVREDFAQADEDWELNGEIVIVTDSEDTLHAAWSSVNVDAMLVVLGSQVFYRSVEDVDRTSPLPEPLPLADLSENVTNSAPALAVTRRQGVWVTWVQGQVGAVISGDVIFLSDRVVEGDAGIDIPVAEMAVSSRGIPRVTSDVGSDDDVMIAISGVGTTLLPPLHSSSCDENGCFGQPRPVVPAGTTSGLNATMAIDHLGNVYVAWDDGEDIWCTQRQNSPPGASELVMPDRSTHDPRPVFVWTFVDPDAGSSQSSFEIAYSMDEFFLGEVLGGVVTGAQGRSSRYVAPEAVEEGEWYWKVKTRDQLGLWSEWSAAASFLADRTPPTGSVLINGGDAVTQQRVVVLTLNATDNLEDVAPDMYFQISSDPNFPNASKHEWPPPNNQVNQELPPGEGVKVVFFRVFDASDLSYTAMDTILYNQTPFIIVHTPITTAPLGKPLNVSCEIFPPTGITATLFHKKSFEEEFKEIEMSANDTTFWAIIPRDGISILGVEYFIMARSASGTGSSPPTSPAEDPYVIEVFETTEKYEPPIFYPAVTFIGAAAVLVLLVLIWWFRLREK